MVVNVLQHCPRRMRTRVRVVVGALVSMCAVVVIGVTAAPALAAVPNPLVTGPITGGCSPSCPSPPGPASGIHIPDIFGGQSNNPDLAMYGYVENEYFFEGTATAFERDPTAPAWDSTGQWTARPSTTIASAAYKTRMQVIQPADPANFNGTVVVEWLNVTAGLDTPPDYGYAHEEILRDGFIWVGVSAQSVSVNGGVPPGFGLKSFDPVRYGSLVHPGDTFSYDIYSQAAQAIRNPAGVNPLGSSAYVVTRMIADGESQSAGRMVTYINAIQPLAQIYDGFFVHSRGGAGAALFSGAGGAVPSPSKVRTDQTPVLVFETETDTVGHFNARQPDGLNYRLWEPAGTAHADLYDTSYITLNQANQVPTYPPIVCNFPFNSAGQHYLVNAALVRLTEWIADGTPPPSAPPITVVAGVIQRDAFGIALGGIRLPEMDVPTQTQTGVGNSPGLFCSLFGRTLPLPVPVSSLYKNHGKYVSAFVQATNDLGNGGFLLDPDAEELKTLAAESEVP
jgi:hypothetical protein